MGLPIPFHVTNYCLNCGETMKSHNWHKNPTCSDDCQDKLKEVRSMIEAQIKTEQRQPKKESARRLKQYYQH